MRTLLKVTIPVETGNRTIQDGSLPALMERTLDRLHPEAAYFLTVDGKRSALIFFDLKEPSDIPAIAEPFFVNLGAAVEFLPVMNADDLRAGLARVSEGP